MNCFDQDRYSEEDPNGPLMDAYESGYKKGFEAGKEAVLQWLPIETAPKAEGSIVLGFDKANGVVSMILVRYLDGLAWERNFDEGRHYSDIEPTHWMPLPPAPEVSE